MKLLPALTLVRWTPTVISIQLIDNEIWIINIREMGNGLRLERCLYAQDDRLKLTDKRSMIRWENE